MYSKNLLAININLLVQKKHYEEGVFKKEEKKTKIAAFFRSSLPFGKFYRRIKRRESSFPAYSEVISSVFRGNLQLIPR